jgi:hypothetical protein
MKALCYALLILVNSCAFCQQQQKTFCVTKTGTKYHRCDCGYLKYSKIESSTEDIAKRGLTACSVCRPGSLNQTTDLPDTTTQTPHRIYTPEKSAEQRQESVSTQCTAKTKAGARCKRTAASGSTRCWQHKD